MKKAPSIEYAIRLLKRHGYEVRAPITEYERDLIRKALDDFEANDRQFPDELFIPKSQSK